MITQEDLDRCVGRCTCGSPPTLERVEYQCNRILKHVLEGTLVKPIFDESGFTQGTVRKERINACAGCFDVFRLTVEEAYRRGTN